MIRFEKTNMEIESQDLVYLQSRGFQGRTLEEAIEWFIHEHGLAPIREAADLSDLKQLIQILKIRSL